MHRNDTINQVTHWNLPGANDNQTLRGIWHPFKANFNNYDRQWCKCFKDGSRHERNIETENARQSQIDSANGADSSVADSSVAEKEIEIDMAIEEILETTEMSDDEAIERVIEEVETDKNNETLLSVMTSEMKLIGIDFMCNITGINCAAHTLQLAIKDSLRALKKSDENLIRLSRTACKFLRLDSTIYEMEQTGTEYRLPRLENKTRWGSMYLMVSRLKF